VPEGGDYYDTHPDGTLPTFGEMFEGIHGDDTTVEGQDDDPELHRVPQNVVHRGARIDSDEQQVMSYLLREHNEVYTIWKNPDYTGTDPNRVERIFGGVVPFLSYNSEGHPILSDDKEIDHHGHTEFNMVHRAPIEFQEQSTGDVSLENEANIQQTNPDETPVAETPNP